MNERLKAIRKTLKLSQNELGGKINLSRSHISSLENGSREITERIIRDLVRELNVNEHWIRTGEGPMFIESDDDIIKELAAEYKLDDIDRTIIEHFVKLDESSRRNIKEYVINVAKSISEQSATIDPIQEELNAYEQELIAEKRGETLSVLDDTKEGNGGVV